MESAALVEGAEEESNSAILMLWLHTKTAGGFAVMFDWKLCTVWAEHVDKQCFGKLPCGKLTRSG